MEQKSIKDFEGTGQMFWYECQTCGNGCLQAERPDNSECQPECPKPDWKLLKWQNNYKVGGADFMLKDGEV